MAPLTEQPKALRTGISNKKGTGAKLNQLDQVKKFAADIAKLEKFVASKIN